MALASSLRQLLRPWFWWVALPRRRGLFEVLRGDSAFSTEPFARLLERYLSDAEVAAIAAEGRKGRSLLIGTTNLDAARPVIWDITRIAMSGAPGAKGLIHDVIRASTAIPGAFPPVLFKVEAKGVRYDEMHVDGGVTSQLFLGPTGLEWRRIAERASMGFNLARVPADFDLEPDELFDPEYMRALFERGFASGRDEASWIRQGH